MAPPCAVTVSAVMEVMPAIFSILRRVPPSAVPQGEVEWLEPTARTGAGYLSGLLRMATMSWTDEGSTTTAGWETMFPNQFVTVCGMGIILYRGEMGPMCGGSQRDWRGSCAVGN